MAEELGGLAKRRGLDVPGEKTGVGTGDGFV